MVFIFLFLFSICITTAQEEITNDELDSIYIQEVEQLNKTEKVLHAEPLFIDLIRDLGARKGEREWNIGMSLTDNTNFDRYEGLIEYEWAQFDRIGFEIEIPFTYYFPTAMPKQSPQSKINSLKLATQWSFFVDTEISTSMAIGYIHEFELNSFDNFEKKIYTGNVFNPFLIIAKRWTDNLHTLIYTGPKFINHFDQKDEFMYNVNSSIHYMIDGTRNFIGLEINQSFNDIDSYTVLRPQMRLGIKENLLIGIVTGIPLDKDKERFSTFFRLIWEPSHK